MLERLTLERLDSAGVAVVAAAGNDGGTTRLSFRHARRVW
jgi:hypothetical protein